MEKDQNTAAQDPTNQLFAIQNIIIGPAMAEIKANMETFQKKMDEQINEIHQKISQIEQAIQNNEGETATKTTQKDLAKMLIDLGEKLEKTSK